MFESDVFALIRPLATIANPMQVHIIAIGTWMPIRLSFRASEMTIHISPMMTQASPKAL